MLARRPEARIALDIPLRGARDYIHSTDLFAALNTLAGSFLGEGAYLKSLTLRRQAHRQVAAWFRPDANAFGHFVFAAPDQTVEGWLMEESAPVTRRIAFDEAAIARQAVCEPGRVSLPGPVAGSAAFEQLIVLFKLLCAQSHPGKWLFTSIALDRPLCEQAAPAVSRTQLVLNRMVEALLYQDGLPAGRMQMVLPAEEGRA
jgi:hypothetical protein